MERGSRLSFAFGKKIREPDLPPSTVTMTSVAGVSVQERSPVSSVLCRYFANGVCRNGAQCRFSHNRNDALDSVCRYFLQGQCDFGSRCRFDHVRPRSPDVGRGKKSVVQPPSETQKALLVKSSLRADAKEFIPSASSSLLSAGMDDDIFISELSQADSCTTATYASAVGGKKGSDTAPERTLCEFFVCGQCYYGDNCSFIHGNVCDMCDLPILLPGDPKQNAEHKKECLKEHEKDMEASFAVARSETMTCTICLETVLQKKAAASRRFGILEKCKHCFCIECIRVWRGQNESFENKVCRACPACRVQSDFVTPSAVWVEDETEKQAVIASYLRSMKAKPCKHFDQGRKECPFGNKCFYKHAKPDGTLVESDSPRTIRRRMQSQQRENRHGHRNYYLVQFLERRGLAPGYDRGDDSDDDGMSDFDLDFDLSMENVWGGGGGGWSDDSTESGGDGWLIRALQDELRELTFTGAGASAGPSNRDDGVRGGAGSDRGAVVEFPISQPERS